MLVEYNGSRAHLCIPAKGGSTSLAKALYAAFTNVTFPEDKCGAFVHKLKCGWNDIPGFSATKLNVAYDQDEFAASKHKQVSEMGYGMMMIRDPVSRCMSAWKDKLRPYRCSEWTPACENVFTFLMDDVELGLDFGQYLEKWHTSSKIRNNEHFMTTYRQCGPISDYEDVFHLSTLPDDALERFGKELGIPNPVEMGHLHKSSKGKVKTKPSLSVVEEAGSMGIKNIEKYEKIVKKIYEIYQDDYLHYDFYQDLERDVLAVYKVFQLMDPSCLLAGETEH
jgi:hypothetical protein